MAFGIQDLQQQILGLIYGQGLCANPEPMASHGAAFGFSSWPGSGKCHPMASRERSESALAPFEGFQGKKSERAKFKPGSPATESRAFFCADEALFTDQRVWAERHPSDFSYARVRILFCPVKFLRFGAPYYALLVE